MPAILKTWPAFMPPKKVLEVFTHQRSVFFFTLGRGRPQQTVTEIYHTHRGRILGHFTVDAVVRNMGDNLPKLTAIDGTESEWQIKLMNYVAICPPPFYPLEEKLYHEGFRGWRYFDLDAYRGTIGSRVRL